MSFFLSNDSPVLNCHFHLKISHFMTPYFMCISGITNDRNYVCHLSSAISPLSRSLHSMLRNLTSLFFPAACSSQAAYFGSPPASTLVLRRASPSGSSTAPTPRCPRFLSCGDLCGSPQYLTCSPSSIASARRREVFSSFASVHPFLPFGIQFVLAPAHVA